MEALEYMMGMFGEVFWEQRSHAHNYPRPRQGLMESMRSDVETVDGNGRGCNQPPSSKWKEEQRELI